MCIIADGDPSAEVMALLPGLNQIMHLKVSLWDLHVPTAPLVDCCCCLEGQAAQLQGSEMRREPGCVCMATRGHAHCISIQPLSTAEAGEARWGCRRSYCSPHSSCSVPGKAEPAHSGHRGLAATIRKMSSFSMTWNGWRDVVPASSPLLTAAGLLCWHLISNVV